MKKHKHFILVALFLTLLAQPQKLEAQQSSIIFAPQAASPWVENEYVRTRLISNLKGITPYLDAAQYLGWEIELKKTGWKTYWRTPGEAGNPPVFTWDGSVNISGVDVLFPYPERFQIFGIQTFGYSERVVLPIRVTPQITNSGMDVKMHAEFMACKDICIPFSADYSLNIPLINETQAFDNMQSVFAPDIRKFLNKTPVPEGESGEQLFLENASLTGKAGQQKLVLTLKAANHLAGSDIYIEAHKAFKFGPPQRHLEADGTTATLTFPVDSLTENDDLHGQKLTLTMGDGWGRVVEKTIILPK